MTNREPRRATRVARGGGAALASNQSDPKQICLWWDDSLLDHRVVPDPETYETMRLPPALRVDVSEVPPAAMAEAPPRDWRFDRDLTAIALLHIFVIAAASVTPEVSVAESPWGHPPMRRDLLERREPSRPAVVLGERPQSRVEAFGARPRVRARVSSRSRARDSGLLKLMNEGSALGSVLGSGGLGTGINDALDGLRGAEYGEAGGGGGLETRGSGAGGNGRSLSIGTFGHSRGAPARGLDLGSRARRPGRVLPGRQILVGSLSPTEVSRVIDRHLRRFRYCYEKELNANPNLEGRVALYFRIGPTGQVIEATIRESGLGHAPTETCLVRVVGSLRFPKPRGGGQVVVTYPFLFSSTGGS